MHRKERRSTIHGIVVLVLCLGISMISLPLHGADAAALYKGKCAACHGPDGSGETAMGKKLKVADLRQPEIQKKTDDELFDRIAKGKDRMPAFEKRLTKDEIRLLVHFIRSFEKK